jgi:HD-like signal output (HDOD) protein
MSIFRRLMDSLMGRRESGATRPQPHPTEEPSAAESAVAVAEAPAASPPEAADAPQPWWVPRGEPVCEIRQPVRGSAPTDAALYQTLTKLLDDPSMELPRLPQITERVLSMLRGNETNYQALAQIVEQDAALTAEVLRVANSVAYRGFTEIRRLDLAFVRLGQRALKSLILGVTLKAVTIRTGGPQRSLGEELWRRSLASGVIVSELSSKVGLLPDDGFLLGLLHDIGMLAILKVAHDHQHKAGVRISRTTFDQLCDQWHEHLGMRLADAWNLPDPLPEIIGNHHREPAAQDPLARQRNLIAAADAICALLEYAPYVPYDFFKLPCVQRLGLAPTHETLAMLGALPERIAERMESF